MQPGDVAPPGGLDVDVAVAGLDDDFKGRLTDALPPRTRLVPYSLTSVDSNSEGPAAIIVGPEVPLSVAMELATSMDSSHPETSVVIVAPDDVDTLEAALLAGARDVWCPESTPDQISDVLAHVLDASRRHRGGPQADEPARRNEVIVAVTAKGGTGQTMTATNLALGIAAGSDLSVAIIDLDLQFGDVAEVLQILPEHDLADAAAVGDNVVALKTMLAEHRAGVHVLAAPNDLAAADRAGPAETSQLVELIGSQFDVTVVDAGDGLDEHVLGALDHATSVVVVTTANPPRAPRHRTDDRGARPAAAGQPTPPCRAQPRW